MQIYVVGATGYIGSAVCEALKAHGHHVSGSARSDEAARRLRQAGVEPVRSDITDSASLAAAAKNADGVVYTVQYNGQDGAQVEAAALGALVDALAQTGKPLLYTSGVWLYGSTGDAPADENATQNPTPVVAHRPMLEGIVLDGASKGVRSIIVRPGDVYGRRGGMPAMWVQSAKESGSAQFVSSGSDSHWPVVHVDDLAALYVLALEKAPAGAVYNANDETAFTVREMAEAASRGAGRGGAVTAVPLEEARKQYGAFGDALVLDSRVTSKRARTELGWGTRETTILDDLTSGSYVQQPPLP